MKTLIAIVWILLIFGGCLSLFVITGRNKLKDKLVEKWLKYNEMDTH